uniref:Uncharacterized protein n=1 Tax=Zea mays TaxID=4577 RepID=A0A804PJG6_MAIZE
MHERNYNDKIRTVSTEFSFAVHLIFLQLRGRQKAIKRPHVRHASKARTNNRDNNTVARTLIIYHPPALQLHATRACSVVADLGGGHGDADGRVLLLRLGGPVLGARHGGAGAADGCHGRRSSREHDGAASVGGGPGLGCC